MAVSFIRTRIILNNPFINCPRCLSLSHIIQFTRYSPLPQTVSLLILAQSTIFVKNFFQVSTKFFSAYELSFVVLRRLGYITKGSCKCQDKSPLFYTIFSASRPCVLHLFSPQNMPRFSRQIPHHCTIRTKSTSAFSYPPASGADLCTSHFSAAGAAKSVQKG